MSELFRKLNLGQHSTIHVLNAPASFEPELANLASVEVKRSLRGKTEFVLVFAVTRKELDEASRRMVAAATDDAVLWVAYPKGSSRRYKCEFSRDDGWTVLGEAGYEPVRMVAIDEDWSALRFRKAGKIGRLTRSRAISVDGKRRIDADVASSPSNQAKVVPAREPNSGRTAFATHEEYFEAQPAAVRPLLEWIQKTTETVVPGASRCVSYGMPAFRLKKMFLYFAGFKQHIGIYPPLRQDADLIRELEPYRGPKGNLSFPLTRPLPKVLVKRVVIALAAEHGGKK
jgi:uncharacterized protein YdhG (YjbR/CyaY superfamily)